MTDSPRFRPWALLRILLGVATVLVFLVCLAGIIVSGPIIAQPGEFDTGAVASAGNMRETVRTLAEEFAPRDVGHPAHLEATANWLLARFQEYGLEASFQEYVVDGRTFRNVVAVQPGAIASAPVTVLGAHYDSFGSGPGANDNASGVAVLLETARTLPQRCGRGDRYFVAFSTEEPPHFGTDRMGSHAFAADLQARGIEVDLMIALDSVGYYSREPASQRFPVKGMEYLYPSRGSFVAVVGDLGAGRWIKRVKLGLRATRGVGVVSFRGPASLGVDLSDHSAFRKLGYPAVLVTDTAFLRDDAYHTADDRPERLHYPKMARLVEALQVPLWDAEAPDRCAPASGDPE